MTQHDDFFFKGIVNGAPRHSIRLEDFKQAALGASGPSLSRHLDGESALSP
jgi:hypothetical protein